MNYYGFIQSCHGADHLYVYTEAQIKEAFLRCGIDLDVLPKDIRNTTELDGFPSMGGSNSSPSIIYYLPSEEKAIEFVKQEAFGPDFEDPTLVDIAEYYWDIHTDEGCAKELLAKAGLDKQKQETLAMRFIDGTTERIREILRVGVGYFYEAPYCWMRESDVMMAYNVKELLSGIGSMDLQEGKAILTNSLVSKNGGVVKQTLEVTKKNDCYAWKFYYENPETDTGTRREFSSNLSGFVSDEPEASDFLANILTQEIKNKDPFAKKEQEEEIFYE